MPLQSLIFYVFFYDLFNIQPAFTVYRLDIWAILLIPFFVEFIGLRFFLSVFVDFYTLYSKFAHSFLLFHNVRIVSTLSQNVTKLSWLHFFLRFERGWQHFLAMINWLDVFRFLQNKKIHSPNIFRLHIHGKPIFDAKLSRFFAISWVNFKRIFKRNSGPSTVVWSSL